MSVEFRQRTPGEYARILWRRKWLIAIPAVVTALAVAWVVWKLPNVYESRTLLTIRPPSISSSIVPQLSNDDLSTRINSIGQEVVSRTSLEPLILKYNLYAAERMRGEPMDSLVERMRTGDIQVTVNTGRNDVTNAFYISFRGADPKTTQAVTAELASKYTKAQTQASSNDATATRDFFERRLEEAKRELDAIDAKRIKFMSENMSHLPSQLHGVVGQLSGLREEQKSISTSLDLMSTRRASIVSQQSEIEKRRGEEIDLFMDNMQDPRQSSAYASLVSRREQLKSDKENLLTTLRPKHPDVLSKQAEITNVQKELDEMLAEYKQRVEDRRKRLESLSDPRALSLKRELAEADAQIDVLQKRFASNSKQIDEINRRLGEMPPTEVGLEVINREYLTAKSIYDDMLEQSEKAKLVSDVQSNAQGESIAVIDTANLPERPIAPKRPLLMAFGLAAGLMIGFASATLFEVPRLLTIQNREDAEHYTGLPVLVTLPVMRTPREERRLRLRRAALAFASIVLAVFSVPALAFVLKVSRVLDFLA